MELSDTLPDQIKEELFCLQFELQSLSTLLVKSEAERWVPNFIWPIVDKEHRARYEFAAQYVSDKKVLDVACGCGLGSVLLAELGNAMSVLGADIDSDTIRYGSFRYPSKKVTRKVMDVLQLEIVENFDVAVSFETIEHLEQPELFIKKVHMALKKDGILIISTPIASETTKTPFNPYHKNEWSYTDFHKILEQNFEITEVFVQSIELKKSKLLSVAKRILRINSSSVIDPKVVKPNTNFGKVFRGYQLVVCKKI